MTIGMLSNQIARYTTKMPRMISAGGNFTSLWLRGNIMTTTSTPTSSNMTTKPIVPPNVANIKPSALLHIHNEHHFSALQSKDFIAYSSHFLKLLGPSPSLTLIEKRDYPFAHEAGAYDPTTNSIYITSHRLPTAPYGELTSVNVSTLKLTKNNFPLVVNGNGACHYPGGGILYCSQGDLTTPSALVLVNPKSGTQKTLLDNYRGRLFNSLNDVVVHHPSGDVYFTDPNYGYDQAFKPAPQLPNQVYRFSPQAGIIQAIADGFIRPNGLCFSPDYKKMYITDTGGGRAHHEPGKLSIDPSGPASIYVYDVDIEGRLTNRRMFGFVDNGLPDGIKCDEDGNVWTGCGDGIHVFDTRGDLMGKVLVRGGVANFCFAVAKVWIFNEKRLYVAEVGVKGCLEELECVVVEDKLPFAAGVKL